MPHLVSRMSKLSLEDMPSAGRLGFVAEPSVEQEELDIDDSSTDSYDSSSHTEDSDFEHDSSSGVVRSPTKLAYIIDHLPEQNRSIIRDTFSEPPKIALQKCRLIDDTYAFQMTEMVTRSIRIRTSEDGGSRLSCSCESTEEPCKHLLWLLDRITQQTLNDRDFTQPLKMTARGYAEEMGDPFQTIANYHLDVLADGLHCPVTGPDTDSDDEVGPHRVQEARELLSSVYNKPPEEMRHEIFSRPSAGRRVIKRGDLDRTIFRMLLDNHHFFHYFRASSSHTDPINDPFRKLYQRVDRVIEGFDHYSSFPFPDADSSAESPRDVAWTARHLTSVIRLIRSHIFMRDRPLKPCEVTSAVRTLIHILDVVVSRNHDAHSGASRVDRNLYLRLIGDGDQDFVIGELNFVPEAASQFLSRLEEILEQLGTHGAPASYVEKFRSLLGRLRTSGTGSGLKRHGPSHGAGRKAKRMK